MELYGSYIGYGILLNYRQLARTFNISLSHKGKGDIYFDVSKYLNKHKIENQYFNLVDTNDNDHIYFGQFVSVGNTFGENIIPVNKIIKIENIIDNNKTIIDVCINYFGKTPKFVNYIKGGY